MLYEIEDLFHNLESPIQVKSRHDALHLGLLLESHSSLLQDVGSNTNLLPAHLRSIVLSRNDQVEIVDRICDLILRSDNATRYSLFWVLSKAAPEVAFGPSVIVVANLAESLDPEASYQALSALDSHIFHDYDGSLLSAHSELLREHDITGFLEKMNSPTIAQRINTVQRDLERIRKAMT